MFAPSSPTLNVRTFRETGYGNGMPVACPAAARERRPDGQAEDEGNRRSGFGRSLRRSGLALGSRAARAGPIRRSYRRTACRFRSTRRFRSRAYPRSAFRRAAFRTRASVAGAVTIDGGSGSGSGSDSASLGSYSGTGSGVAGAIVATGYADMLGQSVGTGQCVALAQATSDVGYTSTWSPGAQVEGDTDIAVGTVIATFGSDGTYTNTYGQSHTAIYLGQDSSGIYVEDQWLDQVAHTRLIPWTTDNSYESGSKFYVVTHRVEDGRDCRRSPVVGVRVRDRAVPSWRARRSPLMQGNFAKAPGHSGSGCGDASPRRQIAGAAVAQSARRDPTAQGDLPIRQQGRARSFCRRRSIRASGTHDERRVRCF